MKICPDCQRTFDDDVELCDNDGAALVAAPDSLTDNPELAQVIQVNPDDRTSVIDLEAMEDVLQERARERSMEQKKQAQLRLRDEDLNDPERTGTAFESSSSRGSALYSEEDERTELTRIPSTRQGSVASRTPKSAEGTLARVSEADMPISGRPKKIAMIAVTVIALLGSITVAVLLFTRTANLQVTSIPAGAMVFVDGAPIGTTPIVKKLKKGSHTLELTLDGHAPYKDVVILQSEGSALAAQLEPIEPAGDSKNTKKDPSRPKADAPEAPNVDDDIAAIEATIARGAFDDAFIAIKNLVKANPNNPRIDALFDTLAEARTRGVKSSSDPQKPSEPKTKAAKNKRAAELFALGEQAYQAQQFGDAKQSLKEALRYRPRYSAPHRVLARVYLAEQNIPRVRYHLNRFIKLGGKDSDGAVRRWLEDHPLPL